MEPASAYRAIIAPTRFVATAGVRYAYRTLGSGGVPLLLLQRFQGTMDDWDPALLETLSDERRVVLFDDAGIGRSIGTTAATFAGAAASAAAFVAALGLERIDVLGWSLGGFAAIRLALDHPDLVRRVILASASPGHVADAPAVPITGGRIGLTDGAHDDDYIHLFFSHGAAGRTAGAAHLVRLRQRASFWKTPPLAASLAAQLAARAIVMTADGSLLPHLSAVARPVLVAHGMHDVRTPAYFALRAAQALPQGRLLVYPETGHGFLFERPVAVGGDFARFLDAAFRQA